MLKNNANSKRVFQFLPNTDLQQQKNDTYEVFSQFKNNTPSTNNIGSFDHILTPLDHSPHIQSAPKQFYTSNYPLDISDSFGYFLSPIQQPPLFQPYFDQSAEQITDDINLASEIDDLWGNQIVSRKLQKLLECGRDDQKDYIISKLERISPQIERDVFGNYVVQKVFEKCNDKQRLRMFNKLKGYFVDLAKNAYGCRVIQKLIEYTSHKNELQEIFINEIKDNLRSIILDNNGNYVIHKMQEIYTKEQTAFFLPEIEIQVNVLVQRNYGCKILLRCFEIYEPNDTNGIQNEVIRHIEILGESEPGNYIIQYLIKRGTQESKKQVKLFILKQFIMLSLNKYASNTVEKLIETLDKEELRSLASSLIVGSLNLETNAFLQLSIHQYGSYVIKTLLVLSDKDVLKYITMHFVQNPQYTMFLNMNIFGNLFLNLLIHKGQRILHILTKQNIQAI